MVEDRRQSEVVLKPSLSFGEVLKRYRVASGLTQEELAELAGLSARSISDLERGLKQHPQAYTIGQEVGHYLTNSYGMVNRFRYFFFVCSLN